MPETLTQPMTNSHSKEKLEEALDLVNQAAREKKEDVMRLLEEKYTDIRASLTEVAMNNKEILRQVRRVAEEKIQKNPLGSVGSIAAGALIFGFILGLSKRSY